VSGTPRLARDLSFGDVVRLSVSSITPASGVVVILPATIVALEWGAPVALLCAGVLCLPIAYCYASLGRAFPSAGAEYSFAHRFLGRGPAYATWLTTVAGVTLALAAILQGATWLLGGVLDATPSWWLLPMLAVIPVALAPQRVLRLARITSVILWTEIIALGGITTFGVAIFLRADTTLATCASFAAGSLAGLDVSAVLAHTAVGYFALAGFGTAIVLSEEDRDDGRSASRAVRWSLLVALGLEIVALVAILLALQCGPERATSDASAGTGAVLSELAALQGSTGLRVLLLGGAFIAAMNAAIVITMQVGRVVYSAAREGFIPAGGSRTLSRVNPATNTPVAATLVVICAATAVGMLVPPERVVIGASAALMVPPAVVAASHLAWQCASPLRRATLRLERALPLLALVGLGLVAVFAVGAHSQAFIVPAVTWILGLGLDRLQPGSRA
jgi:amino acid transporter